MNNKDDDKWISSKKNSTAWSSTTAKIQKGRRVYGRRANSVSSISHNIHTTASLQLFDKDENAHEDRSRKSFRSKKRTLIDRSHSIPSKLYDANSIGESDFDQVFESTKSYSDRSSQVSLLNLSSHSSPVSQSLDHSLGNSTLSCNSSLSAPYCDIYNNDDVLEKETYNSNIDTAFHSSKSLHRDFNNSSRHQNTATKTFTTSRLEKPLSSFSTLHDKHNCDRKKINPNRSKNEMSKDEENRHPNTLKQNKNMDLDTSLSLLTPLPPTKLKKILYSPSPHQKTEKTNHKKEKKKTSYSSKENYDSSIRKKIHKLPLRGFYAHSPTFNKSDLRNSQSNTSPNTTFPSSNNSQSSSFSSISRSVDPTWIKKSLQECTALININRRQQKHQMTSNSSTFLNSDELLDTAGTMIESSPAKSTAASACSSRKRGCDSPILDVDDAESFHSAISISRSISRCASASSYRSRTRSRILSPSSSKKKMVMSSHSLSLSLDGCSKTVDSPQHSHRLTTKNYDSDSDSNSTSTKNILNQSRSSDMNDNIPSDDENELTHHPEHDDDNIFALPPKPRRTSITSHNSSFEDVVFGSAPDKAIDANVIGHSSPTQRQKNVMATMSSYNDLKFLIKELRKRLRGDSFKTFGMVNRCTIVPPNSWIPARKVSFVQWATNELGFTLRYGGSSVTFLQISCAKASEILRLLEEALLNYKMNGVEDKKEEEKISETFISSSEKRRRPITDETKAPFTSIKITQRQNFLFNELPPHIRSTKKEKLITSQETPILDHDIDNELANTLASLDLEYTDRVGMSELQSPDLSHPFDKSNNEVQESTPTLVRTVTAEPQGEAPLTINTKTTTESTFFRPRERLLSSEGSARPGVSFLQLMHGISPNESQKSIHSSKLVLPLSRQNGNHISPHCRSDFPCLTNAALSFDAIETPMPKRCLMKGLGNDWGKSEKCPDEVIEILTERFEKSFDASFQVNGKSAYNENVNSNSDIRTKTSPYKALSCLVSRSITATACNSNALGFDFEVDNSRLEIEEEDDENDQSYTSEDDPDELEDQNDEDGVSFTENQDSCPIKRNMHESMGAAAFAELDLNDEGPSPEKIEKRKKKSFAKYSRMSICATAVSNGWNQLPNVQSKAFSQDPSDSNMLMRIKDQQERLISTHLRVFEGTPMKTLSPKPTINYVESSYQENPLLIRKNLLTVFSYMNEKELLYTASAVCHKWAEIAAFSHAAIMLSSVGCTSGGSNEAEVILSTATDNIKMENNSIARSMQRSWEDLNKTYPWAMFLGEGAFKRVYKVWNSKVNKEEAVSVMDINLMDSLGSKNVVGTELAVSVLLSSLVRRRICPNFIRIQGVFTCQHDPHVSLWGSSDNPKPQGSSYDSSRKNPKLCRPTADCSGLYQYIRMECCKHGDMEEFLKRQPEACIQLDEARMLLFQMAFALHSAEQQFGLKHYDVKLLNFFLQATHNNDVDEKKHPFTVLQYGIGSHTFNLRMPTKNAMIAKLADYGTADMQPGSNGQPVTIGQFTTIENTPPDYMILGDNAKQGYGHDCFGLGLCMLHLLTGHAPYEEILETVLCPNNLMGKLKKIWEKESVSGYEVIRSLILSDVYEDENGDTEGEPDETIYHTFYRFLVLLGIPEEKFQKKGGIKVWQAISSCLQPKASTHHSRTLRRRRDEKNYGAADIEQYERDRRNFSFLYGKNEKIARAREILQKTDGGTELLVSLLSFDPDKRATALDVINSNFMAPLREESFSKCDFENDIIHSFSAYRVSI